MAGTVGTRRIVWQGGEHDFCLAKIGDILSLESTCDSGIMAIMRRLETDSWKLNDVRETVRLGLIGGGMSEKDALQAVKVHVDANPRGLAPSVVLAHTILAAVIIGVPDDPVGKTGAPEGEEASISTETTAASGAAQSSASQPA